MTKLRIINIALMQEFLPLCHLTDREELKDSMNRMGEKNMCNAIYDALAFASESRSSRRFVNQAVSALSLPAIKIVNDEYENNALRTPF